MRSTRVHSKSVAGPWWLVPELVDWERVARQVDFYRVAEDFEFKYSFLEVGISTPWWKAAQWILLVLIWGGLASLVGVPQPLWLLACVALGPLVAGFCAMELARCTLTFAALAAKEEAAKALRVWEAALAAAAPGDSRVDTAKRAYKASNPLGSLSRHALGMALISLTVVRWDLQGPCYLVYNFEENPPRWMPLRRAIYRLIEPLTRVMKRSRLAAEARETINVEFEGAAGVAVGRDLFPGASALNESRALSASCRVPLASARRARL